MGKFDGILICSDYDGTYSYGGVPAVNIEAVKYFQSEGGLFTFSTGRRGKNFTDAAMIKESGVVPNAPVVGLSGAELYDPQSKETLYDFFAFGDLEKTLCGYLDRYQASFFRLITMHTKESDYEAPPHRDEIRKITETIKEKGEHLYKSVMFVNFSGPGIVPEGSEEQAGDDFTMVSNGYGAMELTAKGITKGSSVKIVKDFTRAKTLVCVGDFHGDIPMLKEADIAYAVENAHIDVKNAAHRITKSGKEGAIAAIIADLERDVDRGLLK